MQKHKRSAQPAGAAVYHPGFRRLVKALKLFCPRWKIAGHGQVETPCLFVSRHLNNYGPVVLFLHMPVEYRLWVLDSLVEVKDNYNHLRNVTFRQRMRFPLWLCSLFAGLLCHPAAWVYRGMRAIPVHRSSRKLVQTLQETMEALEQGENVMVLTDVSYTNTDVEVGELYGGFVYVARLYKRKTGKDLRIVPVLPDIRTRTLFFHEALIYREEAGYGAEKERMKAQLHQILSFSQETEGEKGKRETQAHVSG